MKAKKIRIVFFIFICFWMINQCDVRAEKTTYSEKDFQCKKYDSENGLAGTAVKCILSSDDGFLWIGGYEGLQRYDGNEFKAYLIDGKALQVNDLEQDREGKIWIGTNGNGIYRYDGNAFKEVKFERVEDESFTINKMCSDSTGKMWIGTRNGLFVYDEKVKVIQGLEKADIYSIVELEGNRMLIIERSGTLYLLQNKNKSITAYSDFSEIEKPRCCVRGSNGEIYIGTASEQIIKVDQIGNVVKIIEAEGLKCINSIYECGIEKYWVCTDTGIGLLENDVLKKTNLPLEYSVEEVCMDYEHNFWFVSSRQGMVHVFKNTFPDLGGYLRIDKTVNSVFIDKEYLYIGCDDGLYCYLDEEKVENSLTQSCVGERIRQINQDRDGNLWVSTYQNGIKIMGQNKKVYAINQSNSRLTTNQIRCTKQMMNGEILVGTEQGVFVIGEDYQVRRLVDRSDFNDMRILDVRESKDGNIYVATEGNGVYVIKENSIQSIYTKKQGLYSNAVIKVVPSEFLDGVWIVSGIGMNFISSSGEIKEIKNLGEGNILSLEIIENGEVCIFTGNGLYRMKEEDLFYGVKDSLKCYSHEDGLPIDFTVNAWNYVDYNVLYMCGTNGLTCLNLKKKFHQQPLKMYVSSILVDGKKAENKNGTYYLPSQSHEITIDVRCINFVHQEYHINYFMEGIDQEPVMIRNEGKGKISYKNLKGGTYLFRFKLLRDEDDQCISELKIPIVKNKKAIESSEMQVLLILLVTIEAALLLELFVRFHEIKAKRKRDSEQQKEKDNLLKKMIYKDVATGVYNRNFYEEDKKNISVEKVFAVALTSVNYMENIEKRIGVLETGEILRDVAGIMSSYGPKQMKIYRITEKVFCILFFEDVILEQYIQNIKGRVIDIGKEKNLKLSISVGAIYNNKIENETLDALINRCERIRLLDERRSEAEFVNASIHLLS